MSARLIGAVDAKFNDRLSLLCFAISMLLLFFTEQTSRGRQSAELVSSPKKRWVVCERATDLCGASEHSTLIPPRHMYVRLCVGVLLDNEDATRPTDVCAYFFLLRILLIYPYVEPRRKREHEQHEQFTRLMKCSRDNFNSLDKALKQAAEKLKQAAENLKQATEKKERAIDQKIKDIESAINGIPRL